MAAILLPRRITVSIGALVLLIFLYLLVGNALNTKILKKLIEKIDNFEKKIENLIQLKDEILRKTANDDIESRLDHLIKLGNLKETVQETLNNNLQAKQQNSGEASGSPPDEKSGYKNYQTFHDKNLKRGVPELLLKEIEKSDLTIEQLETHCHKDWFSQPSILPYDMQGKPTGNIYFSQANQDKFVDQYFKQKRNGVFLEVGAGDGIVFSNSLFFERERNWTGLLIEPTRYLFERLLKVHRKAYAVNACLSVEKHISLVKFYGADLLGGIEKVMEGPMLNRAKAAAPHVKATDTLCIPVYSLLEAINMLHINFFSLDVEGAELEILKTIPFAKVKIDLFLIEYAIPGGGTREKLNALNKFFENLGTYKQVQVTGQDVVFALKENETSK